MKVIRTLISRGQPHDGNILGISPVLGTLQQLQNLVVDPASIWIVDSTMSAKEELGNRFEIGDAVLLKELPKLAVRVDDGGNTLGGVEPCDLDKVFTIWPCELGHALFGAETTEFVHVVVRVPGTEIFVQAIEPVREDP